METHRNYLIVTSNGRRLWDADGLPSEEVIPWLDALNLEVC